MVNMLPWIGLWFTASQRHDDWWHGALSTLLMLPTWSVAGYAGSWVVAPVVGALLSALCLVMVGARVRRTHIDRVGDVSGPPDRSRM